MSEMSINPVNSRESRSAKQLALVPDQFFLIATLVLWTIGLEAIDPGAMTDIGLASVLPITIWAAAALAVCGFCFSLRPSTVGTPIPFLFLVLLILILHATPAIAYETLRYSWAWKHLGIVDYIQRHGDVDPNAAFLSAYHNWPGFFMASAAVADMFNLNALKLSEYVRFFPVALNIVFLCLLQLIYGSLTRDRRLVWAGCALFVVGNWVGQDYFSPQGTSYALYLAILALSLAPSALAVHQDYSRWPVLGWLQGWISKGKPDAAAPGSKSSALAALGIMVLMLGVVVVHQLMPIVMIIALAALVLLGRLNIGFAVFAAISEALWLFYFADVYVSVSFHELIAEFGKFGSETVGKLADYSTASSGQRLVSMASRGLSLIIGVAAALGGFRRLMAGYRDATAIALTLAPMALIIMNSYGGEVLFRIYLYALPFLAFFAAALFFPSPAKRYSFVSQAILGVVLIALVVGFVLANNGKDRQYRFSHDEVAAAVWLYETAPEGALIVEGARSYPSQFLNYERFSYLPISEEYPEAARSVIADPVKVFGRWLARSAEGGFVIFTRSQKAYVDDTGVMPPGSLDRIELLLLGSVQTGFCQSGCTCICAQSGKARCGGGFGFAMIQPPRQGSGAMAHRVNRRTPPEARVHHGPPDGSLVLAPDGLVRGRSRGRLWEQATSSSFPT